MKPYGPFRAAVVFLLVFALMAVGTSPLAFGKAKAPPSNVANARKGSDALAKSGFEHFYNTEYDAAIRDFEKALEANPNDAQAVNHVASGVLFRELYRIGALDTELYAKDDFLDAKQFPVDPKVRDRVKQMTERALALSEERLKANPNDVEALYARGVTRGLKATYLGMMEKSWLGALRAALGARRDHERVLELNPGFTDAKFTVGVHNYVVGSINWAWKVAASVVGITGSKQKGIQYLYDAANAGGETSVDAKLSLSMFLRREQRYPEAIKLVTELAEAYPKSFLLALERANLLNAAGHGRDAIAAYRHVMTNGEKGIYWHPRMEQVAWGLGEALRGQREYAAAAQAYEQVTTYKDVDPDLRDRSLLAAGQVYDVMQQRDLATKKYQAIIAGDKNSRFSSEARKYLHSPYRGQKG